MRVLGSAVLLVTAVLLPTAVSAQERTGAGTPANICKELAAFLHPPATPAPAPAPSQQTAVQAPSQGGGAPTPPAGGGEPQKSSGLSGPTPNGGPGATGPQGASQNSAAPSGAAPQTQAAAPAAQPAAPAAPAAPPPKKPAPEEVERADAAIGANDIAACQASARGMRRAGVVMPMPLMSLAALDLKFLDAAR